MTKDGDCSNRGVTHYTPLQSTIDYIAFHPPPPFGYCPPMESTLPPLPNPSPQAVTRLLSAWREGDSQALESLTPLIYEELRLLAQRYMRRERNSHTLQATAVVHEAFVRMVDMHVPWQDRNHFYAVAAKLMRRILVDHAKSKSRIKRGGLVDIEQLEEDQ